MDSEKFLDLLAAECADFFVVAKAVLEKPTLVHLLSDQDVTALMFASCNNNEGILDLLIGQGADIHFLDNEGANALHWAARNDDIEAVKTLLAHGADATAKDIHGKTPRDMTRLETIQAVLDAHAAGETPKKHVNPLTPEQTRTALELCIAAAEGDGKALCRILRSEPDAARWQEPYTRADALIAAAYYKKLPEDDMSHLIDCGANPLLTDRWGKSALNYATEGDKGADYRTILAAAETEARGLKVLHDQVTGGASAAFRVGKPLSFKR